MSRRNKNKNKSKKTQVKNDKQANEPLQNSCNQHDEKKVTSKIIEESNNKEESKPDKSTASNISTEQNEVEQTEVNQKQTNNNVPTPKKNRIKSFIAKLRKVRTVMKDKLFWLNFAMKLLRILYRISIIIVTILILWQIFLIASLAASYMQDKGINNAFLTKKFLNICFIILSLLSIIIVVKAKENNKLFKILPSLSLTIPLFIGLLYITPKLLLDSVINAVNYLCAKYDGYKQSDLLSYFGAIIGAALAVLGAFLVMICQLWSQKNQDEIKQKKQQEEEMEICKVFIDTIVGNELKSNIETAKIIYDVYKDNGLFDSYDTYLNKYKEKGFFVHFDWVQFNNANSDLLKYNNPVVKEFFRKYKLFVTLNSLPDIKLTEEELKQLKLDIEKVINLD